MLLILMKIYTTALYKNYFLALKLRIHQRQRKCIKDIFQRFKKIYNHTVLT